jgi:TolB-like protein/DNA-binding winged helix-turn-helix (wHTH) protein
MLNTSSETLNSFLLGPWTVEPLSGSVNGPHGETQHLEPKVMEVIVCLAEHANEVVTRDQLLNVAWGGSANSDEQLTRAISVLRRVFHDDPSNPEYIETVTKRGYRLLQKVRPVEYSRLDKNVPRTVSATHFNARNVAMFTTMLLVLALAYIAFDEYGFNPAREKAIVGEKSIAVLPFVNMSDNPSNEHFSDGISEDILNLLARVPDLKVIGRTSSFSFKGKNEELRVIGQALGVQTLLEGSVRMDGDKVRIVAQLIDASDGTHIWSETYDRALDDVFAVQDDVAAAVIDAMNVHITATPLRGRPTNNWQAYSSFLEARAAANRLEWQHAEILLKDVIELDPNFAEAYELLTLCYWHLGSWAMDQEVAQRLTYEAASTAISIEPDMLFAQTIHRAGNAGSSSPVKTFEALDWAFRKNPNNSQVLDRFVFNLTTAGYLDEALSIARRSVLVDPLSLDANLDLLAALYAVGRVDEAMRTLDLIERLGLSPNNWLWFIAGIELAEGHDETAIGYFESYLHQFDHPDSDWVRELVIAARDPDSGQAYLDQRIPEIVESLGKIDSVSWRNGLNNWYLYFGFIDRYFELIDSPILSDDVWTEAEEQVWQGHVIHRFGFTSHPDYLDLVTDLGIVDVWDQRGPPDHCRDSGASWICN